ncbi:MAG TPA: hypothetical protein VGF55_06945 [Gemmataceae bacterium]|jgi:hypothetical protein
MATHTWTDADTQRAREFWQEYQKHHDVSDRVGQTVGIDPETGDVHFGETAAEIGKRLLAEGRHKLLYFVRVGSEVYARRHGKRCSPGK